MNSNKKSWWSYFAPAVATQRRFTVEELREQYGVLVRNPVVDEANKALVVETIRSIAEYMIWGDQNEPRIFDFFLENNILVYLHKVLLAPANRSGEVAKQVLQTLSIIIQNVRSETGIFFLFSNNHINNILDLDFDFEDEEVLGYYISFLKTISLKLNKRTVHFFFDDAHPTGTHHFPLYSKATALAHHREGMVRAAVRTLTLNVYSVDDPRIQAYVTSPGAAGYFLEVAGYLGQQVQVLDLKLQAAEGGSLAGLGALDSALAEVEDVVSYVSDVLSLGVPIIAQVLAERLWLACISPLLLQSLLDADAATLAAEAPPPAAAAGGSSGGASGGGAAPAAAGASGSSDLVGGHSRKTSWGPSSMLKVLTAGLSTSSGGGGGAAAVASNPPASVRPTTALFALERLFQLISYPPLLHQLLLALACGDAARTSSSRKGSCANSATPPAAGDLTPSSSSPRCRHLLLRYLRGGDAYAALAVLRLLVALLNNRHISLPLLSALRMAPKRRQPTPAGPGAAAAGEGQEAGSSGAGSEARELALLIHVCLQQLQGLTVGQGGTTSPVGGSSSDGAVHRRGHSLGDLPTGGSSSTGGGSRVDSVHPGQPGQPCGSTDLMLLLTQQYLPKRLQALVASVGTEEGVAVAAATAAGLAARTSFQVGRGSGSGSSSIAAAAAAAVAAVDAEQDAGSRGHPLQQQQQQQGAGSSEGGVASVSAALRMLRTSTSNARSPRPSTSGSGPDSSTEGPPVGSSGLSFSAIGDLPPGVMVLEALLVQRASAEELAPVVEAEFVSMGPQVVAALLCVLQQPGAPLAALCLAGWLLYQLLPVPDEQGAEAAAAGRGGTTQRASSSGLLPDGSSGLYTNSSGSSGSNSKQRQGLAAAAAAAASVRRTWRALEQQLQQEVSTQMASVRGAFELQLGGMWCDSLVPLVTREWGPAREQLLRPVLRASSEALLSGPLVHQLLAHTGLAGGGGGGGGGSSSGAGGSLSVSAVSAVEGYSVVQRWVALEQLRQLLSSGGVSPSSLLPPVSEGDLKQVDITEGSALELARDGAVPCLVSFAPGQERRVYFAVAGVSQASDPPSPAARAAALLRCLPVAVLADPNPGRPSAGVVLSVAPLLGADPCADTRVAKWLHVHVRPSVRGLLRVLRTCGTRKGGFWAAVKQLADGHWVLAFADAERAATAQRLVGRHVEELVGRYKDLLAPLLSGGGGGSGGGSSGGGSSNTAAAGGAGGAQGGSGREGAVTAAAAAAATAAAATAGVLQGAAAELQQLEQQQAQQPEQHVQQQQQPAVSPGTGTGTTTAAAAVEQEVGGEMSETAYSSGSSSLGAAAGRLESTISLGELVGGTGHPSISSREVTPPPPPPLVATPAAAAAAATEVPAGVEAGPAAAAAAPPPPQAPAVAAVATAVAAAAVEAGAPAPPAAAPQQQQETSASTMDPASSRAGDAGSSGDLLQQEEPAAAADAGRSSDTDVTHVALPPAPAAEAPAAAEAAPPPPAAAAGRSLVGIAAEGE